MPLRPDTPRIPRAATLLGMLIAGMLAGCVTHTGQPAVGASGTAKAYRHIRSDNLVYTAPGKDPPQHADLFLPEGVASAPVIVLIHGGGWIRGQRDEMDGIAERAVERGYAVLNIDYRLAPQHPYPAALDDVHAAIEWAHQHAAARGFDASRISVWGYSAGAHLAALAGTLDAPASQRPHAVVAGGVPADMVRASTSDLVGKFMGGTLEQMPERYRQASPLHQVSADDAPGFYYHGTWDRIVWPGYSRQMRDALSSAGVPAELFLIHGLGHIATFVFDGRAVDAALDFLDRQMPAHTTAEQ
ncbi:MAG: alpha/beta hydrolase [Pseudomonadota bacterium]|nr:alpha/beta hydrolase [Pseudomonadota bacterium]